MDSHESLERARGAGREEALVRADGALAPPGR